MEIVTWPFRRFISYVCGKLLAGYLESDLDFQKLGYHDGALSLRDIVLNPAKINESLKDVPYKVLSANIQSLRVAVPRHFLTESIKVTLSDIDVLIMPICNDKKVSSPTLAQCLVPKQEPKAEVQSQKPESPPTSAPSAPESEPEPDASTAQIPKDEDGLTRAINRVLQNLECEVHNLSVRVLTCEFHQDDPTKGVDIPTILFRLTRLEYRNSASFNPKADVLPGPEEVKASTSKIAKTVLIGQYAVFLMDRPILSKDEFGKDPNIAKLVFPFSYPPICHPSTMVVSETNVAMAAKVELELDFEKKLHKVSCSFNNVDVLVTPLQIYTLSKMAGYVGYLFSTVSNNNHPAAADPVPILMKPTAVPEAKKAPCPSPAPAALATRIEINAEIFRITARMLFEDPKDFKRYFHPYKSEELGVEGQILSSMWKTPYNYFEFLLVNTQCETTVEGDSLVSVSGKMRYICLSNYVLQNFTIKRTGQVLDDSVSTIYASAHRAFSVQLEAPNFLAEDSVINPNRFHFCLQRIIEIKSSKSVSMMASNIITDECEASIESHLPHIREMDESREAVHFEFKLEKRQGKITGDQCINLFDRGARICTDSSTISYVSFEVGTAGIVLDISPEVPLFLDHILNPTGGILFQQPAQYARIFDLYNTELLSPEISEIASVLEEFSGALKIPSIPPPQSSSCESKSWILQKLELKVPFVRAKCWLLDPKRNQLFDFYKDRNVDSCRQFLDRMRDPRPKAQQQQLLRENPYAMVQICRCMDICRISETLSGRFSREATSIPMYQYMYYRDELLILDVLSINISAREIYESSAANGRVMVQALLADAKLDSINLYGHIEGKMRWLGRTVFNTVPYSFRLVSRDRITHSNKLLADAEIVGDAVRVEFKAEGNDSIGSSSSAGKDNADAARGSEIGVIETCAGKAGNKEVVQVDFQQEGDSEKFNPFVREASEFADRELQLKRSAKTYVNTSLKQVAMCVNIEFIAVINAYLEACTENVSRLQFILDNKAAIMRDIESYRKDEARKLRRKEQKPERPKEMPPEEKKVELKHGEEALDSALDLPLIKEESKMSVAAKSDSSSESSEEGEKKSAGEEEKSGGKEEPATIEFVFELSVSDISAYLAESRSLFEVAAENADLKEPPPILLDDDDTSSHPHGAPSSTSISPPTTVLQPLLTAKLQAFQGLVYKFSARDTQIKLQVGTGILVDNSLYNFPRYSPYLDSIDCAGKRMPPYVSDNLIKAQEDMEFFLSTHADKIVMYKEEAMKATPIATLSLRLIDRSGAGLSESDIENECSIDVGLNGVVVRPELCTKSVAKLVKAFKPPPVPQSPVVKKRDSDVSYEKLMAMSRRSPAQAPAPAPAYKQLIKISLSVRNFTIDLWPTLPISTLVEIDPPYRVGPPTMNKELKCRARQRTLMLLDRLVLKCVSAQFVGQEKCDAHIEDTRLVALNTDRTAPVLLRDPESLLNSTLSVVHKLGFSDIATLERVELRFATQTEKFDEERLPTQRLEVNLTSLVSTTCCDSLVTAIRASNGVLTAIGDFQTGIEAAAASSNNNAKPGASGPEAEIKEAPAKAERSDYEVLRQARLEELKLSKDINAGKAKFDEMFEIVNQEYKQEGRTTMRSNEKIDSAAMKEAMEAMAANPDYMSQPCVIESEEKKPDEKIEGEVIIQSNEEGNATISKGVEILNDHVTQPKAISHPYEIEFHALPAGYDKPRLTICASVNKVAFILFDGTDFETPTAPDEAPGPGNFVMVDNPTGKDPHRRRKTDSFVELSLQNIGFSFYKFNEKTLRLFRTTLSVEDVSCSESLSQTLATSVLGMIHHERAENVAKFTVEMLNSSYGPSVTQELPELVLKVKVEPIQFLLHQKVLEFLRDYAAKCQKELLERHAEKTEENNAGEKKPHEEEKKSPMKPVQRDMFVQKATISQFYVKFNYRSYKLTMSNLYKKEMLELLNIADIRDLVITFKKFEGRGFNTLDEMIKCISQHYTNDILNNQLLTCVTAVSPIRSITNIVGGFVDIFRLPMQSYRKRRKLWSGLTEGLGSFASKVATESRLIGQTIVGFVVKRFAGGSQL